MVHILGSLRCRASGWCSGSVVDVLRCLRGWTSCWGSGSIVDVLRCLWSWASGRGSWSSVAEQRSFGGSVDVDTWDLWCTEEWSLRSGVGVESRNLCATKERSLWGSVSVESWNLTTSNERSLRSGVSVDAWDGACSTEALEVIEAVECHRSIGVKVATKGFNGGSERGSRLRSSLLQARACDSLMWVPMLVMHLHWVSVLAPSSDRGSEQNSGERFHVFYDSYLFFKRSAFIYGPLLVQLFSVTICCPKINGLLRPTMKIWI